MKKTLLVIALLAISLSVLPAQSGDWGGNVTWRFSGNTLTITGNDTVLLSGTYTR